VLFRSMHDETLKLDLYKFECKFIVRYLKDSYMDLNRTAHKTLSAELYRVQSGYWRK
jgi:hypothetical protein